MTAVLLCLVIGLTAVSGVLGGLLVRSEGQLDDRDAECGALREHLGHVREHAAYLATRLVEVTKERDRLRGDAHLHETWTINGGGAWGP